MALRPENERIRGLSLCAGVGGLDLGLHIAEPGYSTVCYVERDAHAAACLVARMADAALCEAPVWSDLRTFDGRPWGGRVDILSAGYPCQPFSSAGKRLGERDPRHLWPDVARIIRECEPPRVFLENVEGHLSLGFPVVAEELRAMGYRVKAGLFSALEVGAPHLRRRLFIMADADGVGLRERRGHHDRREGPALLAGEGRGGQAGRDAHGGAELGRDVGDDDGPRMDARPAAEHPLFPPPPFDHQAWATVLAQRRDLQPGLLGLEHGVAAGMERRHAAGNGVVPLAAALAYRSLDGS